MRNFRNLGMIWAFEAGPARPGFAREFFTAALRHGLLLRPIGNAVYFMPPYVVTGEEFALMVDGTCAVIEELATP